MITVFQTKGNFLSSAWTELQEDFRGEFVHDGMLYPLVQRAKGCPEVPFLSPNVVLFDLDNAERVMRTQECCFEGETSSQLFNALVWSA